MFPNNSHSAGNSSSSSGTTTNMPSNVRKPVTRIVNPYAKKRPRPNPAAPISNAPASQSVPHIGQQQQHHHAATASSQGQSLHQDRPSIAARGRSLPTAPLVPVKNPPTVAGQQHQSVGGTNNAAASRQSQAVAATTTTTAITNMHRSSTAAGRIYSNASRRAAHSSSGGRNPYTSALSSQSTRRFSNEGEESPKNDNNASLIVIESSRKDVNQSVPTGKSKRDSLESLGDSSIDWEEAVRVIDCAHNSSGPVASSQTQTQPPQRQNQQSETESTAPPRISHYGDSAAHDNIGVASSSSSSLQNRNNSMANSSSASTMMKKPPPVPTAQRSTMASLRPSLWSNTNTTNNASSSRVTGTASPSRLSSPQLSQQYLSQEGKVVSSPAQHPLISKLPRELQFTVDSIQPIKDDNKKMLIRHANISKPLANGWTLFDHQKKAILKALAMRRFILALDMGLGKTLIGCVWARAFQKTFGNCKIIVICPVSLKKEWTRTATDATELRVETDEKAKPKKKKTTKTKKGAKAKKAEEDDESIETDENNGVPKVEIYSWAKVPTSIDNSVDTYVVVCDEAHSLQSMQAARTKDLLTLVKPKRCVGVLLLTGTPMKNGKPSNLFPLLRAVRHPFGSNQRAYETQFCGGRTVQFGRGPAVWDAGGSSNLPQLRELVSSHLLHLKKDDCLKSLPPKTRKFQHIPVSHRMQLQHTQALQDIAKLFTMSSKTDNDNSKALLGACERLRLVSAMAKVDAGVNIAKGILEKEPAIVIFTSFVRVAKALHQKLECAGWPGELLTGEVPGHKRQDMVDNFQNGNSAVFVCTFGAGGVGLTLTAARSIMLLDRPWTPGDAHQAEDRIRRIGQMHPVTSIWVTAFDVDKQIDAVLESKTDTASAVLDQDYKAAQSNGSKSQKISIFQLIKEILPGATRGGSAGSCVQEGGGRYLSQTSIDSYCVN